MFVLFFLKKKFFEACADGIQFLKQAKGVMQKNLDGENIKSYLEEFGIRIFQ
jgi:hypothetical protein